MRSLLVYFLGLIAATSLAAVEKKIGSAQLDLSAELAHHDLHLTEEHKISLEKVWQHPVRVYYRSFLAGRFPWSQDVTDFRASLDGVALALQVYRYGHDRVMLRLPAIPEGKHRLLISYTVRDIRGAEQATLPQLRFWDYPLQIEEISVKVTGFSAGTQVEFRDFYNREKSVEKRTDSQALLYGQQDTITPAPELVIRDAALRYEEGLTGYLRHFAKESVLLPVAGVLIVLMLLLHFVPAHFVLGFVSIYMFIPFALWISRIPGWIHYMAARKDVEPRAAYIEHFYSEVAIDLAVAALLLMLALYVVRGIWRAGMDDYYLPYTGLVGFFALLLMLAQDPEFLLMLPVAAFFPVAYPNKEIARFFGADAHLWIEKVIALGKIGFDELSSASGLSVSRLNRIFSALPMHPVAIDHKGRQYLSAETLAALENTQFCNNCGGTLQIEHSALLQCPYCRSDYAVAMEKQTQVENTPPLVVRTIASFLRAWGAMLFAVLALLALFGTTLEMYALFFSDRKPNENDWLDVVILLVMGVAVHGIFIWLADRLEKGKGYFVLTIKLAVLSLLLWPIFALRALHSLRSKFFFGNLRLEKIRDWLAEKKYLSLAEFAQRLRAPEPDAMTLAHFLTSSGQLDAVYDRRSNTLTERSRFRDKAAANSCLACGGVVSVLQGARICRYCGTRAG